MSKLKIVIISGVIFPRIAPRAFRATELAKSLASLGHEVTLISSLGKYDYTIFEQKTGIKVKSFGNSSFDLRTSDGLLNVSLWKKGIIFLLRKALYFPEILWAPRVKKAIEKEGNFDLLITIAIPYSVHWGASLIKTENRKFKTWISDCGDPFMGNKIVKPYFYFSYLEKFWGKKTDFITVPVEGAAEAYYPEVQNKIHVIPQGFNFDEVILNEYVQNEIPTFLYAGLFYPDKRDPRQFLEYLIKLNIDFRFIIYSPRVDIIAPYVEKLSGKIEIRDVVDRETLFLEMSKVDFLINIKNKDTDAQVPSKLIDYTLSKRPILEISSDFGKQEKESFDAFLNRDYTNQKRIDNFEQYNACNVAKEFLKLHNSN